MSISKSILNIHIHDLSNEKKKRIVIKCRWHTSIKDLKDKIHTATGIPPAFISLFSKSNPKPLTNNRTISDVNLTNGSVLFMWNGGMTSDKKSSKIYFRDEVSADESCLTLVDLVKVGLERNFQPKAVVNDNDCFDGTSGVYYMKDGKGGNVGVFKPSDEEQGMENNPKLSLNNFENTCQRSDFKPGFGFCRETAAYLMDVDNMVGVPPTVEVYLSSSAFTYRTGNELIRPKLGSLQRFVHSVGTLEDFGKGVFSDFEVQKIALFDMRVLNNDRHSGNLLVRKIPINSKRLSKNGASSSTHFLRSNMRRSSSISSASSVDFEDEDDDNSENPRLMHFGTTEDECADGYCEHEACDSYSSGFEYQLSPIDHGYCFPSKLHINDENWVWLSYPQVKKPVVAELIAYMNSIDIEQLLSRLRKDYGGRVEEEAFFLIKLMHNMILDGLNRGLTLFQIAECIIRNDFSDKKTSLVEDIIEYADYNATRALSISSSFVPLSSCLNSHNYKADLSLTLPCPISSYFGKELRKLRSLDDSMLTLKPQVKDVSSKNSHSAKSINDSTNAYSSLTSSLAVQVLSDYGHTDFSDDSCHNSPNIMPDSSLKSYLGSPTSSDGDSGKENMNNENPGNHQNGDVRHSKEFTFDSFSDYAELDADDEDDDDIEDDDVEGALLIDGDAVWDKRPGKGIGLIIVDPSKIISSPSDCNSSGGLVRTASFSAFSSNKLYSPSVVPRSAQRGGLTGGLGLSGSKLQQARDVQESEFTRLRNDFIADACNNLISKKVRTTKT